MPIMTSFKERAFKEVIKLRSYNKVIRASFQFHRTKVLKRKEKTTGLQVHREKGHARLQYVIDYKSRKGLTRSQNMELFFPGL